MKKHVLTLFACLILTGLHAQKAFTFTPIVAHEGAPDSKTIKLNTQQLLTTLAKAPDQRSANKSTISVELPLPDGTTLIYRVYDADLLPANKKLNSYRVVSDFGTGRIATGLHGISAVIEGPEGYYVIDPINAEAGLYRVATYQDYMKMTQDEGGEMSCGYDAMPGLGQRTEPNLGGADAGFMLGGQKSLDGIPWDLHSYDVIMTNTGEFAQKVGGTKEAVQDAFNTAISTVNALVEPQIGISLNLIERPGMIYLDPGTDPFNRADNGTGLLSQVINAFDDNSIGIGAYDLGHVFTARCSNGLGGVVNGLACTEGKMRGVTCVGGTVFGAALRIMAHEVAHQFSVSHTWNNCPGSEGQRASSTSYEPGAGNTIMSYAGSCGSQNIGAEQAYYHTASINQFYNFTRNGGLGDACATKITTDNITPEVSLDHVDGFSIPASTPFRLEGSGTDANGDVLLFNWEQYNRFLAATDIRSPRETAPLFQSVAPTEGGFIRYFPRLDRVVNNISTLREVLPDYSRGMTFRLTAHDYNEQAGAADWSTLNFQVSDQAGPFTIGDPANRTWAAGGFEEVTWDVAGTDAAPINCRLVNILLSTDNGESFDRVLAQNVANTGRASITVPEGATTASARIMVEAADNIFFNVNPRRFDIIDASEPGYTLQTSTAYEEICLPDLLTIQLSTASILGFSEQIELAVDTSSLPAGTVVTFSSAIITPGENSSLTINMSEVNFTGIVPLTIIGITPGDTARREVLLDVVATGYQDLELLTPDEGSRDIILTETFDWTDAQNAENYHIQISTSAAFEPELIFAEEIGLEVSEYLPGTFFDPNTVYFWRVRPWNRCGYGEWQPTHSFKTVASSCQEHAFTGNPIILPGSGNGYTRSSTIYIDEVGTVTDLNIPQINIRYNFVSSFGLNLVSPAGTSVVLYDQNCRISSNIFRAGYDDDAPSRISCPPREIRVVTPIGDLSSFNGESIQGEWKLEVVVAETNGGTGSINTWKLELCTSAEVASPTRINNDTTLARLLGSTKILRPNLYITSPTFSTNNVLYTLTDLPDNGQLELYGQAMDVGDTFRQADVDGEGISYVDLTGEEVGDEFGFIVTTPDGGYLPVDYHQILVNSTVGTHGPSTAFDASLSVFPNPVSDQLTIRWGQELSQELSVEVFDVAGRLLKRTRAKGLAGEMTLETGHLPSGIYLIRVGGAVRRVVKR